MRTIVSIATIPSRIAHIWPTVQSLLDGDVVPDQILIVRPEFCELENSTYSVPGFLVDPTHSGGRVRQVISEIDWGPSTKYLGVVNELQEPCYLVIADDDVIYKKNFLADLVRSQSQDHGASFSFFTYRVGGLTVGQGCDGMSFWSPNTIGMRDFAHRHVRKTPLRLHDDLWVAFFLSQKGIKIKRIKTTGANETIYEQLLDNNVLSALEGENSREAITRTQLKRLLNEANVPLSQRARFKLVSAYDHTSWFLYRAQRKARTFWMNR